MGIIENLPVPLPNNTGFPWTEESAYNPSGLSVIPKISIVTPSFQQANFIEETIRSVILQNYPNLEYIVVDGDSSDGTREILELYQPWINTLIIEKDKGQSEAINKGWKKVNGKIFNWINSDDLLEKNSLWAIAEAYNSKKFDVLTGKLSLFKQNTPSKTLPSELGRNQMGCWMMDNSKNYLQPSTFLSTEFIRSNLLNKEQLVDENLHFIMDWEMMLRLLTQAQEINTSSIDATLAHFRLHEESKSGSSARNKGFQEEESNFFKCLWKMADKDAISTHPLPFWSEIPRNSIRRLCNCYWLKQVDIAWNHKDKCKLPYHTYDFSDGGLHSAIKHLPSFIKSALLRFAF